MAKIALFGLPACGKGTLAQKMEQQWGWRQLSTGDIIRRLRAEPGPIGDELRALPTGSFASDDLMVRAVKDELTNSKYDAGVIFDGFPRTVAQLEAMDRAGIMLDMAIALDADEQELASRAVNRRVHVASGRVYNLVSAPPKVDGLDDVTGQELTWRADDQEGVVWGRFADYWSKTHPVVVALEERSHQGGASFASIDARGEPSGVWAKAVEAMQGVGFVKSLKRSIHP